MKTTIAWAAFVSGTAGALARGMSARRETLPLFRAFAEPPFFGFRGIAARSGVEYRVSVAAEMDMYPKYSPWVFVTPTILGARKDGKRCVDVSWSPETSQFADVIGAVVAYVEVVHGASTGTECG